MVGQNGPMLGHWESRLSGGDTVLPFSCWHSITHFCKNLLCVCAELVLSNAHMPAHRGTLQFHFLSKFAVSVVS